MRAVGPQRESKLPPDLLGSIVFPCSGYAHRIELQLVGSVAMTVLGLHSPRRQRVIELHSWPPAGAQVWSVLRCLLRRAVLVAKAASTVARALLSRISTAQGTTRNWARI